MGVHLMGVYLMGVHLIGVFLMGVHLMGVHIFIGVHLLQACISYRRTVDLCAPHANSPSLELALEFAPLIHSRLAQVDDETDNR
jgi:hypothetical protein